MSTSSQAIVVEKLGEDKLAKLGAIQSGAKVRSLATTDFYERLCKQAGGAKPSLKA